ncbi:NADPH:quinone oxidoreductase family protein [Rhodococcus oxybenzonivorans]|uniref:NADPH:quinone oxidoreductase family protein n=1 Tax=Rhodococcus oxybenzonivorans TaxID=1990687 RepID=UPI002953C8D9|nr:NADPH:quinone oxidoreductase family protein [Rhodococcus oxybenzonivorans]MDV7352760.1 NADPH:quinone oxidoreductase family protein [Rhodococcus oxybenzonivorans]
MRAARIHELGSAEAIRIDTVERPPPGPRDVLVAVEAAAVNFPDTLMIAGRYQTKTQLPFVPGHECAGVVTAVGSRVTRVAPGDRVATLASGAFAEYVVVPESSAVPIPEGVDAAEAAATWVCHLTAYHALRSTAQVQSGDVVLVLGAGGGLGLAAVELATALGATVIAAASNADKLTAARERGARHTVDYAGSDLREGIRAAVGPGAVQVVIDPVGGRWAEPALRELSWGGRYVTLGYASGEIPSIALNLVLLKGAVIKGMEIRTFAQHDPHSAGRDRMEFTELWQAGRIRPRIHARYPLEDTAAAMTAVANRQSVGKVVIEIVTPGAVEVDEIDPLIGAHAFSSAQPDKS